MFVCAQCGFANAWIPLCLWCEWTSTEATKQFEANLPRPRRLSAPPPRAVPAPKKTKQLSRKMSTDSTISSGGPHTPKNERPLPSIPQCKDVPGITTILQSFHRDMCHDDRRLALDPHNIEAVNRDAAALTVLSPNSHNAPKETVDGGVHRVAAATSITVLLSCFSSTSTRLRMAKCTNLRCAATAPDNFLSERCTQARGRRTQARDRRSGIEERFETSPKKTSTSLCPPTTHTFSHLVPHNRA